ncbi:MAG: hypothetical protein BWY09_01913 [Candidatus Hydrogenedentes bacterium ADurb.Bin179]|nr:MAG: hypothetical protein BWY09_01913 [Candidatus Hydrogenedentes bacterium ADurb.Bin179]
MGLIKNNPPVTGQYSRGGKIPRFTLYRHIGKEHMMVDNQQVCGRHIATRVHKKAISEMAATAADAHVRLAAYPFPQDPIRHKGQVAHAAVMGLLRPIHDTMQLFEAAGILKKGDFGKGPVQFMKTHVIAAALDQAGVEFLAKAISQQWQVVQDDLFLQIDGTRGNDDALFVA